MNRAVFAFALLLLASPVLAQEDPKQCTQAYIEELHDDVQANKDMRRWTTDYLRPACRAVQRTEDISGSLFEKLRIKKLWDDTLGGYIDARLTSKTCKYFRKLGERVLTPEADEQRIAAEIKRCKDAETAAPAKK